MSAGLFAAAPDPSGGELQAKHLWHKRQGRCQRWQSAFDVLDTELASIKGAMRAYSDLQRQQPAATSTSAPIAAQ
jgi:heme oxygenase